MRHHNQMGCGRPPKTIVHPTKCNVVHSCTVNETEHIHPSHTTFVNHHLQKNNHVYPHTTSYQNTFNQENVYGGTNAQPNRPPNNCSR